jgi:preprotein translocase subunit SecG
METRLIIAYALIALMTSFAILGLVMLQRKRAAKLRRDAGQSPRPR